MVGAEQEAVQLPVQEGVKGLEQEEVYIGRPKWQDGHRQHHQLVVVLMQRLLSVPSVLSLSDQSDSESAAPQIADNIALHLPCACILHNVVFSLKANHV
jgi:hypothetical protein